MHDYRGIIVQLGKNDIEIGTIISPPPTPNSPAVKPAIAPMSKYMINSINVLPLCSYSTWI